MRIEIYMVHSTTQRTQNLEFVKLTYKDLNLNLKDLILNLSLVVISDQPI